MTSTPSKITERDIHRSKYLLNAAIPRSLQGKHPLDVRAVKTTVFAILDSTNPVHAGAKGAIIEGDLFDAARALEFEARRKHDYAFDLYLQAAILYAPVMTVKSVFAFEKADECGIVPGQYRSLMARLYERMGDVRNAQIQTELFKAFTKKNPKFSKTQSSDNQVDDTPEKPSGELAYFPIRS